VQKYSTGQEFFNKIDEEKVNHKLYNTSFVLLNAHTKEVFSTLLVHFNVNTLYCTKYVQSKLHFLPCSIVFNLFKDFWPSLYIVSLTLEFTVMNSEGIIKNSKDESKNQVLQMFILYLTLTA
jgi:hypothetical protein